MQNRNVEEKLQKHLPFMHAPVVGSQCTPGGQCSQPVNDPGGIPIHTDVGHIQKKQIM